MLRFKVLHQSGPAKVLCKQKGSGIAEPPAYISGQTGQGIVEPPSYIPGQTGGKGSKKAKKDKKVKADPNINFSSFNWRKDYFGTIGNYGGEGYEKEVKAKTIELLKYLKEQPAQLLKDQNIDKAVNEAIDEIEEALLSDNYDDIETAFTNATDDLNDPTGRLADKQFIDIKVKKERVKAGPKTAAEKAASKGPKRELTETQKARMTLKGDDRIINQYKNALGEKKWYRQEANNKITGRNGIASLQKQLATGKYWSGLPIDDKTMAALPAKIAAKQKEMDDIVKDWVENRKPIYLKYKAEYEKLVGHKIEFKTVKTSAAVPILKMAELDKEDIAPELKKIEIKEISAAPEPPAAPKRKAPPPPSEEEPELEGKYAPLDEKLDIINKLEAELEKYKIENAELKRRLQIYEEAEKAKKEIEKEAKDLIKPPPPPSKKPKKKKEEKKPDVKPGEKVVAKSELDKCKEELAKCKEQLAQKGSGKFGINNWMNTLIST
jgi:hypothetical protein